MPKETNPFKQCITNISEKPPFRWFSSPDMKQFAMFGMEGAGKTTLLYKLKIPSWKKDDITQDLKVLKTDGTLACGRDPVYHYEEFRSHSIGSYGIWEVPGNEVWVRQWPMFYRYLRLSAVFFVVDAFSPSMFDMDKINSARYWINFLLNEDELRTSAFVLVLNVLPRQKPPRLQTSREEDAICAMLGIPEISEMTAHKERFYKFSCNCADFDRTDNDWEKCLKKIQDVYMHTGEGSYWGLS